MESYESYLKRRMRERYKPQKLSVLDSASCDAADDGYFVYADKLVLDSRKITERIYEGEVLSDDKKEIYTYHMELDHPRKCSCTCPKAAGRKLICKHLVAAFFTVFLAEAKCYYKCCIEPYEEKPSCSDAEPAPKDERTVEVILEEKLF